MNRNILRCICLVFLCMNLAGCSNEPEKAVPATHTIVISGMQFNPAELTIEKGDTIVFLNKDLVVHDITQSPDKLWSSSKLSPGEKYKIALRTTTGYYCSIHPVMKGQINVR